MNKILEYYIRPIVHMRQKLMSGKFGLVLGAGISKPFNLPNWNKLILMIANNSDVEGVEILKYKEGSKPQAAVTQMLFEHFKSREIEKYISRERQITKEIEKEIYYKWRKIIHSELWKNFKLDSIKKGHHPYLDSYIPIIKRSALTINYNFDDLIQQIILDRRTIEDKEKGIKGFETVWDERLQFQSNTGIIYHPNGFLPLNLLERKSDNIVFSEVSFADQLIASMSGHYSTLLHHLSKNTCLFIGLSLEDSTLKHLLRQNSQISPGHYHYYIAYTPDQTKLSKKQETAITEANFELYNLITLFLNDEEIKLLGESLLMTPDDFHYNTKLQKLPRKFTYYITGPVASGKSTALSYFRNINTFTEWPDQKHFLLAKQFNELNEDEKLILDKWIYEMFHIKNTQLNYIKEGLTLVDRTPLDPLTFTLKDQWISKAKKIYSEVCKSETFKLEPGTIIYTYADSDIAANRFRIRNNLSIENGYDSVDIQEMHSKFELLFAGNSGVVEIDTTDLSVHEFVKKISKVIHLFDYEPFNLNKRLKSIMQQESTE